MSTSFNTLWLKDKEFCNWIAVVPNNDKQARCYVCGKNFELGNMGRRSLTSHADGHKHKMKMKLMYPATKNIKMTSFFTSTSASSESVDEKPVVPKLPVPDNANPVDVQEEPQQDLNIPAPPPLAPQQGKQQQVKKPVAKSEDVLKAEILWAMKTVLSHFSCSSSNRISQLFQRMFPDSMIAAQFTCGKTKNSYLIKFGLSPYFHEQLLNVVTQPGTLFTMSFDESYNKVLKKEQMDLCIRYWDTNTNKTADAYFDSQFLGHTTADDLLRSFLEALGPLNLTNLIQVSMDGPRVNWKFYGMLEKHRTKVLPTAPSLFNLGSCGLHIVHGAFKTGTQSTGWNIDGLLRAMYNCFKDSPARTDDYLKSSNNAPLPLQFCSTRWLEDEPVAGKAILIWKHIVKYVKEKVQGPKSAVPQCQSFKTLQDSVPDALIAAKLQFFITVAKILKPFLTKYQAQMPMMMFISEDLFDLMKAIMKKFIKKSVLEEATTASKLVAIDIDKKENLMKKVDIGFATKAFVDKAEKEKVSALQILEFHQGTLKFLQCIVKKLVERSPLKYPIVKYLSALDPKKMVSKPEKAQYNFNKLLEQFIASNRYTPGECDTLKDQFEHLLNEVKNQHADDFKDFTRDQRCDTLFFQLIGTKEEYQQLWKAIKMVMILSNGQSEIERGFSVNKDVLEVNMGDDTIRDYRRVYDGLKKMECPLEDIPIGKKMLESCRHASSRYNCFQDKQRKEKKAEQEQSRKRKLMDQITGCKKKKQCLEKEAADVMEKGDKLLSKAESLHKWNLVVEGNALRSKGKEKEKEIDIVEKEIKKIEDELKNL